MFGNDADCEHGLEIVQYELEKVVHLFYLRTRIRKGVNSLSRIALFVSLVSLAARGTTRLFI